MVYNVSEGEMAMLRVVLNTTTDQTITVFLLTQDGSGIGKLLYLNTARSRPSMEGGIKLCLILDRIPPLPRINLRHCEWA